MTKIIRIATYEANLFGVGEDGCVYKYVGWNATTKRPPFWLKLTQETKDTPPEEWLF